MINHNALMMMATMTTMMTMTMVKMVMKMVVEMVVEMVVGSGAGQWRVSIHQVLMPHHPTLRSTLLCISISISICISM